MGQVKSKVYVVKPTASKAAPYIKMFEEEGWEVVDSLKEADIVQFIGGEDVTPSWYGQKRHPTTRNNERRDLAEKWIYDYCIKNDIPMVGICRGGQFLWVMNGGKLYQNVDGHGEPHKIYKPDGPGANSRDLICLASSTHHQMMAEPSFGFHKESPKVLAVATLHQDKVAFSGPTRTFFTTKTEEDIEVAVFKNTKSLCFQPHPEHDGYPELREYYFDLIWKYLLPKG